ncbi:hypothetical protein AALP_AA8G056600 [Arabis alpina]|uniref:Uncharacterized protein n=1 Tax=Arabis alpina TaxID=50452 RepID=A0A087G569_ARAAL|nr:hypothetical protein AALP_AA8G056600 [Arabis alpina]
MSATQFSSMPPSNPDQPSPLKKIISVASIAAGIQFGWALQLSLLTPYVQLLGIPHKWASLIWLCGPVSGMIVQPMVGYYSDRCTSRFGRRRPFIAAGAALVAVAVILIGYAADLGHMFGDKLDKTPKTWAILIFGLGFWFLDVANNTLQGPCRAFLGDLSAGDAKRTRLANALFSFFMAVGNILGYAADKQWSPEKETDESDEVKKTPFFGEIFGAFKVMKRPMWMLLIVTALNWIAWFPFLLFDTDWMGREVYGGDSGGDSRLKKLYNDGVHVGALGLMLNAIFLGVVSLGVEWISSKMGGAKRLWGVVNFILAVCLAMTVLVTKLAEAHRKTAGKFAGPTSGIRAGALSLFAILGIPLAITFSIPFALASILSSDSGAGQVSLNILFLSTIMRRPELAVSGLSKNIPLGVSGVVKRAIVIGNGCAGAENQCIGLIRSLGLFDRHLYYSVARPRGGINRWLQWLPISLYHFIRNICGIKDVFEVADAKQIAAMARSTFHKNGPLLVVASGSDTVSVASSIRRLAMEYVFVVQVQHPRSRLERFDLVITPRHDYYSLTPEGKRQIPFFLRPWVTPREPPGRNVFLTTGALHNVDSCTLRTATLEWKDDFASLLKPLVVVNIGGPTRNCLYGVDLAKQLCGMLHSVLWSCGSLRISFSRRTPKKVAEIITRELSSNSKVYIWDGKDPNPHLGHLALADAFIITADSVSMLSEACSTGKPVYVVGAELCTWKFSDFQKTLHERGAVRPLTGKKNMFEKWSYSPLNDNAEAAKRVIQDLAVRGWKVEP